MKDERSFIYIVFISHISALLYIICRERPDYLPSYWQGQIGTLIILSLLLSLFLILPRGREPWAPYAAALLHMMICFIIGNAEGADIVLESLIMIVISSDLCFRVGPRTLWSLLGVCSLSVSLLQRECLVWWVLVPGPDRVSILMMNALFWGSSLLFRHIHSIQTKLNESVELNANLKNIIKNYASSGTVLQGSGQTKSHLIYEEERKIFIHEIHDTVSYSLVNIIALLEAVSALQSRNTADPAIPDLVFKAKDQAKISLRELRIILRGMRNRESASNCDLLSLKEMTNRFEKITGIRIRIEFGNLPNIMEREIYHILFLYIQEGLTNAFKHGRAESVSVYLWIMNDELSALIIDDGRGCRNVEKGLGFYGIEERMKKYGGRFEYRNPNQGFEIRIRMPFRGGDEYGQD